EQRTQRFDELELEVIGQPTDVVMALDGGRTLAATGLHNVGVQRALDQELDRVTVSPGTRHDVAGGLLEHSDELAADDLALLLRIDHSGERAEELILGVDHMEFGPGGCDVFTLNLCGLPLAHQAMIDEHTRELITDGTLHERR